MHYNQRKKGKEEEKWRKEGWRRKGRKEEIGGYKYILLQAKPIFLNSNIPVGTGCLF